MTIVQNHEAPIPFDATDPNHLAGEVVRSLLLKAGLPATRVDVESAPSYFSPRSQTGKGTHLEFILRFPPSDWHKLAFAHSDAAIEAAIMACFKTIPSLAAHFHFPDHEAEDKERHVVKAELSAMMRNAANAQPDRFTPEVTEKFLRWSGFEEPEQPVPSYIWDRQEPPADVSQDEQDVTTIGIHPQGARGLRISALKDHFERHQESFKAELLGKLAGHTDEHGVPLISGEQLAELREKLVLRFSDVDYGSGGALHIKMGYAGDASKTDELVGSPLAALSMKELTTIVNDVLLYGKESAAVYPLLARPKDMRADLKVLFSGTDEPIATLLKASSTFGQDPDERKDKSLGDRPTFSTRTTHPGEVMVSFRLPPDHSLTPQSVIGEIIGSDPALVRRIQTTADGRARPQALVGSVESEGVLSGLARWMGLQN
jgi:hypothetical protein